MKGRSLRATGRATISVDDPHPPYAFVMVEGTVTLSHIVDELHRWARVIAERYATDVDATARRNAADGEILVRIAPVNIVAINYE